jgi:23S rRNA (guanosine2251-2'-O)-methyltransferase
MSDTRYIFGFHAVTAKIRHAPDAVKELFVSTARQDGRMRDLIRAAEAAGVKWVQMEPARIDGLAGGAARHQGVVARVLAQIPYRSLDDVLDTLS